MTIRDLSLLESLPATLDELIDACKPGGAVSTKSPRLSADATRKERRSQPDYMDLVDRTCSQCLRKHGPQEILASQWVTSKPGSAGCRCSRA
jgi:hypothetical protein